MKISISKDSMYLQWIDKLKFRFIFLLSLGQSWVLQCFLVDSWSFLKTKILFPQPSCRVMLGSLQPIKMYQTYVHLFYGSKIHQRKLKTWELEHGPLEKVSLNSLGSMLSLVQVLPKWFWGWLLALFCMGKLDQQANSFRTCSFQVFFHSESLGNVCWNGCDLTTKTH